MEQPVDAAAAAYEQYYKIRDSGNRAAACAAFTKALAAGDAAEAVLDRLPSYCKFGAPPRDRKAVIKKEGPAGWPNCMTDDSASPAAREAEKAWKETQRLFGLKPNPSPTPPPQYSGQPQPVSCSDITGLGDSSAAATNCNAGNAALTQAQKLSHQNPTAARAKYQEAAEAYRRAGDVAMANAIIAQMNALVAALPTNPPSPSPAASQAPPVAQPAPSPNPNPPVPPGPQAAPLPDNPSPADCAKSNSVERTTADWGYWCSPQIAKVREIVRANGFAVADRNDTHVGRGAYWDDLCSNVADVAPLQPPPEMTDEAVCPTGTKDARTDPNCHPKTSPITFGALNAYALAQCPDGPDPDQRRACFENAELQYLLANDPDARAQCSAITDRAQQLYCANVVYLYGPSSLASRKLRKVISVKMDEAADSLPKWIQDLEPPPPDQVPTAKYDDVPVGRPCGPGYGPQPVEGGFGRWDCAKLAPFVALQNQAPAQPAQTDTGSADAAASVDHFEDTAKDVATQITSVTVPRAGANLAPQDRATCTAVAYRAVLGQMKGGRTGVSAMCAGVVAAARAEFAAFTHRTIGTGDRGIDAVLATLDIYYGTPGFGGDLGATKPGMTGLEPSDADRREADCIVRGGSPEECAKQAAANPDTKPQPDCSQAEADWKHAEFVHTLDAYKSHLARFPACPFATIAKVRIETLEKQP